MNNNLTKMIFNKYITKVLGLTVLTMVFSGCLPSHNFNVKLPQGYEAKKQLNFKLSKVKTNYADESERTGDLDFNSADFLMSFQSALNNTLHKSKIFKNESSNNINIIVRIYKNDAPSFGISMQTDMEIKYKITDDNDNVIYSNTIFSKGIAGGFERFSGLDRAYLSNDRAVENNIKKFINDIQDNIKEPEEKIIKKQVIKKSNKEWR